MRPFEIILLILDAVLLLWLLISSRRPRYLLIIISIITVLVLVIHLFAEGFRWQMTPAYVLTATLLLAAWIQRRSPPEKKRSTWRIAILAPIGFVILLLATALPVVLPVPNLPEPSGPYAIGTATYHIVDGNRAEIFGDDPGGDRELMLQVWYPAEPGSSTTSAPYFDQLDVAASVLAERLGLPSFFLGHLDLVDTHALIDAMPASENEAYPLLLFSHGLSGLRMQNTAQFEELASHGYVVASIDHTYDSVITIMPDGRAILHHGQTVMPEGASTVLSGRQLVEVRVQDLSTVLTFLEDKNRDLDSFLHDQIDLDKIGVMGHSTGGTTAIEFCAQSKQCQAVLVQDGWIEPLSEETLSQSLSQPSIYLSTNEWLGSENQSIGEMFIDRQDQDSYQVTIEEMGHNNFTDIPLLTPLAAQIGLGGQINGARGIQILNDYSLAFFNRYLQESDSPILEEIAERYWEVSFESNLS
jgi:predicted dienelactone hydrolase